MNKENKKEQVVKKIAKISEHWLKDDKKKKLFVPFLPKDNNIEDKTSKEVTDMLIESFSFLLKQEYHVFWSHLVFDRSIWKTIDTYLRYKTR